MANDFVTVFWVMTQSRLVDTTPKFWRNCCLYH